MVGLRIWISVHALAGSPVFKGLTLGRHEFPVIAVRAQRERPSGEGQEGESESLGIPDR